MIKSTLQKTLANEVNLKGVGLHTGKEVNLTFKPAPVNTGFIFVRSDLVPRVEIPADIQHVINTDRGTNLEKDGVSIQTSEHVLAALVGMSVNNCYIELDAAESPIMDGSSKFFVDAIESVGVIEQEENKDEYIVTEPISYKDDKTGSEITLIPSDEFQVTTMVDFDTKILGTQNASLDKISDFKETIAPSRTFSFLHELETLLENGLINRDVSGIGADHPIDIDLNNIQQVEIIRGPSSLLYSNGALGGIVNVVDNTITKTDFTDQEVKLGVEHHSASDGN